MIKLGVEYQNANVKQKTYLHLKDYLIEHNLVYLPRKDLVLGWNFHLDPRASLLRQYDFGVNLACCGVNVGLKHESNSSEFLQIGRVLLLFSHAVNSRQTVGSEFSLDWQRRLLEARLGLSHQFNDDTTGKFKLNHHGYLDVVLKHRVSNVLSVGVITGGNLKAAVAEQRQKSLPFGLSLDFKL